MPPAFFPPEVQLLDILVPQLLLYNILKEWKHSRPEYSSLQVWFSTQELNYFLIWCGPQTSSLSVTWELVRNRISVPTSDLLNQNLHFDLRWFVCILKFENHCSITLTKAARISSCASPCMWLRVRDWEKAVLVDCVQWLIYYWRKKTCF